MNIKEYITDLNTRANKLWSTERGSVICVSIFVSEDGTFVQSWFSHWSIKSAYSNLVPKFYDQFIAEASSLEASLDFLSGFLSLCESRSRKLVQEGERYTDKIGFGD